MVSTKVSLFKRQHISSDSSLNQTDVLYQIKIDVVVLFKYSFKTVSAKKSFATEYSSCLALVIVVLKYISVTKRYKRWSNVFLIILLLSSNNTTRRFTKLII